MTYFRIAAALVDATQEPYGDSHLTANFIEIIEKKCAHIINIIYYLAWAMHEGDLIQPAGFLDLVCLDIENN